PDALSTRRTVSSTHSVRRSAHTTRAPWRANSSALARPTPDPAPVTTTALSASSSTSFLPCRQPTVTQPQASGHCPVRPHPVYDAERLPSCERTHWGVDVLRARDPRVGRGGGRGLRDVGA